VNEWYQGTITRKVRLKIPRTGERERAFCVARLFEGPDKLRESFRGLGSLTRVPTSAVPLCGTSLPVDSFLFLVCFFRIQSWAGSLGPRRSAEIEYYGTVTTTAAQGELPIRRYPWEG